VEKVRTNLTKIKFWVIFLQTHLVTLALHLKSLVSKKMMQLWGEFTK
jgi:hypothetical protein